MGAEEGAAGEGAARAGLRGDIARLLSAHGTRQGAPSFEDGFPTGGDYTWVMSGAKVLGPITVGRRCFVAANAVLTRDLGDGEAYTPGNEIADLRRRVEELERLVVEQRSPENHH